MFLWSESCSPVCVLSACTLLHGKFQCNVDGNVIFETLALNLKIKVPMALLYPMKRAFYIECIWKVVIIISTNLHTDHNVMLCLSDWWLKVYCSLPQFASWLRIYKQNTNSNWQYSNLQNQALMPFWEYDCIKCKS